MDIAISVHGVPIRLTDERWRHIVETHGDLLNLQSLILATIEAPDAIVEDPRGAAIAIQGGIMGKTMGVVYKETSTEDGFVITAWLTSQPEKLLKRRILWTKER